MASDSGSSHDGTQSEGESPLLDTFNDSQTHPPFNTMAMVEMLSPSLRRKTGLKGDFRGIVKRAQSSPNVRDLAHLDVSGMSQAEKKRNKLGYHRTAVACVHCRRRKIRCILAMDDPASRCHNCIRLKKDCMFYPVDQQPPLGKRTRSSTKLDEEVNDSSTPETSPPLSGKTWENVDGYSPNHFQTSYVAPDGAAAFTFPPSMMQLEGSGMPSLPYSAAPLQQHSSWNSAPVVHSPVHPFDVGSGHFDPIEASHWQTQMQSSSAGYEYPHYSVALMPTNIASHPSDTFQQFPQMHVGQPHVGQPHRWQYPQGPVRSMSLATPGELQQYHSPFYSDHIAMHQRQSTNGSDIQPPSLGSNTHPTPPSSDTQSTPGAFSYNDLPQMNSTYQNQTWTTMAPVQSPPMPTSGAESFQHPQMWYNAPPGLSKVREEEELGHIHHHALPQIRVIPHYGPKPG